MFQLHFTIFFFQRFIILKVVLRLYYYLNFLLILLSVTIDVNMPRNYKKKLGSRNYKTSYSQENLTKAIKDVETGWGCMLSVSKKFKIPHGTLHNKVNGLHSKKVGGQFRLSNDCEKKFLLLWTLLSFWKIPLTRNKICQLVKSYMDARFVVYSRFKKNLSGEDWLNIFVTRYGLLQKIADNVSFGKSW